MPVVVVVVVVVGKKIELKMTVTDNKNKILENATVKVSENKQRSTNIIGETNFIVEKDHSYSIVVAHPSHRERLLKYHAKQHQILVIKLVSKIIFKKLMLWQKKERLSK
ncbi:hypothetical protein [Soonwooa sp.]|uniref:hypothetical protein n=1 Tax=Soonwooa sp. TaxID=1938592 RepID=UPI0028AF5D91|nr:hypothetical protein [Soonwooa sp.]